MTSPNYYYCVARKVAFILDQYEEARRPLLMAGVLLLTKQYCVTEKMTHVTYY